MRAAVYRGRGVELAEVEKPSPGDDEVLIRVRAASINAPDWRLAFASPLLRRAMTSTSKKKIIGPGTDVAGVVESAGRNVTALRAGDAVFGSAANAFADYVCALPASMLPKPEQLSFEDASCIAASGITALQAVRDQAKVQRGDKVLVNGATGAVGIFAVQIAKAFSAEVTAVCSSGNVDLVRSLGADRVVDYTKEDFVRIGGRYDAIIDNVGNRPLFALRRLVSDNGRIVMVGAPKKFTTVATRLLRVIALLPFDKRLKMFMARLRRDDLQALSDMIASGAIKPVIDRVYPLDQVADALRYVNEGHARAKVVIAISSMSR